MQEVGLRTDPAWSWTACAASFLATGALGIWAFVTVGDALGFFPVVVVSAAGLVLALLLAVLRRTRDLALSVAAGTVWAPLAWVIALCLPYALWLPFGGGG